MAMSIFRQALLALMIFTAVLALPVKVAAQAPAPDSTPPANTAELSNSAPDAHRNTKFPDAPLVAALTPDSSVFGRDAYFRANAAALSPEPVIAVSTAPGELKPHRFWDRENAFLFSAVGGMAAADFYVTHANLASGGKELNPVTRVFAGSTPALAANFTLETSGVMAVSYLFHKTGHHTLERTISFISIGGSSTVVAYDLTHR
jgi:hypothetical protein